MYCSLGGRDKLSDGTEDTEGGTGVSGGDAYVSVGLQAGEDIGS